MLREGKELLQVTLRTELRTWGLVCQARDLNLTWAAIPTHLASLAISGPTPSLCARIYFVPTDMPLVGMLKPFHGQDKSASLENWMALAIVFLALP